MTVPEIVLSWFGSEVELSPQAIKSNSAATASEILIVDIFSFNVADN